MDWKATLEEILAERRQALGEPPSTDDFVALRSGELSEDERTALLEHASVDPEVSRELFEVLGFPESEDDDPSEEEGVGERWQAFRSRLIEEGDLPPVAEEPDLAPRRGAWLPLAATFLLGVAASLVVDRLRETGVPEVSVSARVNLAIVELLPVDVAAGMRGAPEVVLVAPETGGLVLALAVPDLASPAERGPYALRLTRGDGTTLTIEGLNPGVGGVFLLDLPRDGLASGRQELRLLDREGKEVALFELEVELRR